MRIVDLPIPNGRIIAVDAEKFVAAEIIQEEKNVYKLTFIFLGDYSIVVISNTLELARERRQLLLTYIRGIEK